ncbi:metal ABC transporter substrate-binding protein [Clostridium paraputrificum]|uniref:metal ABC transporter substrate-binding protein n=1 Tax=Clostridium paraputrificum TaxID=29363 RepID=UPI003D32853C
MKKVTFVMLGITLFLFLGLGIFTNPIVANTVDRSESDRDIYLNIMTCNKIQYEMVKAIAGDKHNVEFMFMDEKSSNEFKYTDEIISNISNMDLFLYSGNQFEPWINEVIDKLKKGKLGIINLSRGIRTISMETENSNVENPYYWTGLDEYKIALYNVKSAIQDRDPINRGLYEDNYNKAVKQIDDSIKELEKRHGTISDYTFIALDDNMDYFYRAIGISPIKVTKDKPLTEIVKINKLDPNKVIILKDKETEFTIEGYRIINLERYNEDISAGELLIRNYTSIYEGIPVEEK